MSDTGHDTGHNTTTLASLDDADCLDLVPPFTLQERSTVLRNLHYDRAADANGMVAEMSTYRNIPLQKCLVNIYNSMFATGSWQHTLFAMLRTSAVETLPGTDWLSAGERTVGVEQGDVIMPILFNAGLEHAMRK